MTYTDNIVCWPYKGAASATSHPNTTLMDTYRAEAYSDIVNIIGTGVADINDTAAKIERQIVLQKVYSIRNDKRYRMGNDQIIKKQKDELDAVFLTDELGDNASFIPGDNA